MSLTDLFEKLGAPLTNQRWSWGSVREDGTVFQRVWQDRKKKIDGDWCMMITHHASYEDNTGSPGYQERLRHEELVKSGARCYMVMCRVKDPEARPRTIASFNQQDVFFGGKWRDAYGDTWLQMLDRVPVKKLVV